VGKNCDSHDETKDEGVQNKNAKASDCASESDFQVVSAGQSTVSASPLTSSVQAVDEARIQRAVREILFAIGEDPDREGLRETPARVGRMYAELFGGLHQDPRRHLQKFFTEVCDEVVLVRDISFNSMCEHHMLPFMGKAHVAYLPDDRVIGLSKLARVVEEVARRPQVQERMTEQIANLLVEELHAKGVAVVIEAVHTCMTIRGIRKPGAVCVTSAMKGCFRNKSSTRAELMTLIYGDRR
jgi:GTP cyclohydrolase I